MNFALDPGFVGDVRDAGVVAELLVQGGHAEEDGVGEPLAKRGAEEGVNVEPVRGVVHL